MDERHLKLLRIAAIFGAVLAALKEITWFDPIGARQGYSYIALVLTVFAVIGIFVLYRESARKLFHNLDILIPFGLYLGQDALVGLIPVESRYINFLASDWRAQIAGIPSLLYAVWVFQIFSTVIFAGWTIRMILQLGRLERVDAIAAIRRIGFWFGRVFVAYFLFGFAPLAMMIPFFGVYSSSGTGWTMFFMVAAAILLNFGSFAVLIHVLNDPGPLLTSIKDGCGLSVSNALRMSGPVVVHLLILGVFAFASLSFTTFEEKVTVTPATTTVETSKNKKTTTTVGETRTRTETTSNKSNFNYSAELFWIGGFRGQSEWHEILMKVAEAKPFAPVTFKLSLVLIVLAILLKIEIVRRIYGFKDDVVFPGDFSEFGFYGGLIYDDRKIPAPALLLVLLTAVYLLPIEMLGDGATNFKPQIVAELKARRAALVSAEEPKLVSPKIYRGEELVQKTNMFSYEKTEEERNRPVLRVKERVGEEVLDQPFQIMEDKDNLSFKGINAKFVGEVDDEPGTDILVAGDNEGFILDQSGQVKRKFDFKLGSYRIEGSERDYFFPWVQIVDFDGDGKPEIAGHGNYICQIIDLDGRPVWKYNGIGKGKGIDVTSMTVGDVDDDGVNDVIVSGGRSVEVYGQRANLRWRADGLATLGVKLKVFDVDQDGESELLAGRTIVGAGGKKTREIEIPILQHGVLAQRGEPGVVLGFNNNQLETFDMDGQPVNSFEAPLSYVSYTRETSPRRTFLDDLSSGFSIFEAQAARVRLKAGSEKYLVVYGRSGGPENLCLLYIYDPKGALIYYETFGNFDDVAVTPFPQPDGSEHFLIADDGKLMRYSLN